MVSDPKRTALFVTCLVDQFFPDVGEATVRLLEQVGRRVTFPREQTCCGQPAFNMGYREEARRLARRFIRIFESHEEIVAPSGSCVSMVRVNYPRLFEGEREWQERARRLGKRIFELTEFLHANGFEPRGRFQGKVTYHDSCHLLRELGIRNQPRDLLTRLPGCDWVEMEDAEVCCGFGGAFSVKMSPISEAMLEDKLRTAAATGADVITATDCGCLMHLGGALRRRGSSLQAIHIAEILAAGS